MGDYIKRETAINVLSERTRPLPGEDGSKDRYRYMQWLSDYNAIKNLPSADVEERKRGEWIGEADGYADGKLVYDMWYCSNCDYRIDDDEKPTMNFCPHCGADMRGSDNE